MKLGVYGGTFDPIHEGHLAVARAAKEAHDLDRVLVVPAACPPHKRGAKASDSHRLAMVELALRGEKGLVPSDIEIRRGGTSYTVDTLRELGADHPGAEIFLIVGGDSVVDLPLWRSVAEIFARARIVAVDRPGHEVRFDPERFPAVPRERLEQAERDRVRMEPHPASSREIRARLARGERDVPYLPPLVREHIERHGLYGEADDRGEQAPSMPSSSC
ncbi:MAG TPA: nicotinate-nucleotide adenylyltransferase [Planctomycetota bacterium]|nr:nicotinate-nucleotide adenylyltransferase [Planctomycetota bacterium]